VRARDDDLEGPVTSPVTRRQLIIDGAMGLSAVSFLSTALVACGGDDSSSGSSSGASGSANKSTKVRVAYTATAFPSIVNNRAGLAYYGKEFGLDVTNDDLQTFNDSATATQALFSGQADLLSGSFLNDLLVIQKGNPLKVLVSVSNGNDLVMVGRDGIATMDDVLGDKAIVATDSPGGLLNLIYNAMFLANGHKVNVEDLKHTKPYGDSPPRTASFITGQTNVCLVHSTDMPKVNKDVKDAVEISTLWKDVHGMIFEVVASTEKWIKDNPEAAQGVVAAVLKGNRELAKDYATYKKAIDEFIPDSGLTDADLKPIWELARQYEFWPYNGGIDDKSLDFTQEVGLVSGAIKEKVPNDQAVDRTPLDAAVKQIGEVQVSDITGG
jgi:ABC-type nitrate/sulfonate/bicarbonate transport system substrate-binding protein